MKIKYGKQDVTDEDIAAVVKVLKSDLLTQGPIVPLFERATCDYTGAKHAVAVNSARQHFILHVWHLILVQETFCGLVLILLLLHQTAQSIVEQVLIL